MTAGVLWSPTTSTKRGSTITLGGTAQVAAAALASRKGMILQNPAAAAEPLFFSFSGTATTASPALAVGALLLLDAQTCPTTALSVLGATTAHPFVCEEFQ